MAPTEVTREQVWRDLDKRNAGERLVQVLGLVQSHDARGGSHRYAVCKILTAGGRPFMGCTATPERVGQGLVGDLSLIRVDRLLHGRFYKLVEKFGPETTPALASGA